jgi:DNA-binding HxlR family transcriptional regulator
LDAWKLLGKRWSLLILKNLNAKENIRFNELKRAVSGISSTVLADRLLELEREGLVTKKIYPEIPPRVEYSLTSRAKELGIVLSSLGNWVRRWNSKIKISTGVQTRR